MQEEVSPLKPKVKGRSKRSWVAFERRSHLSISLVGVESGRQGLLGELSHRWDAVQTQLEKYRYKYTEKEKREKEEEGLSPLPALIFSQYLPLVQTYSGMQQQRSLKCCSLRYRTEHREVEIHNIQYNFRFVLTRNHSSTSYLISCRNARLFLGSHRHFSGTSLNIFFDISFWKFYVINLRDGL